METLWAPWRIEYIKEAPKGGCFLCDILRAGGDDQANLVLKRGVTLDRGFWEWIARCGDGTFPLPYVSGTVLQFPPGQDRDAAEPVRYRFTNGIVTKVKSADLQATSTTNVAIEELHIAHEGLVREAP